MKNSPRLDKKLLGDYISRPDNLDILLAYLNLFDFRGVSSFAQVELRLGTLMRITETHRRRHA